MTKPIDDDRLQNEESSQPQSETLEPGTEPGRSTSDYSPKCHRTNHTPWRGSGHHQ